MNTPTPCGWAMHTQLEHVYHDAEWGRPVTDDHVLFEFLVLEGAQAGLSWRTVLQRREHYRRLLDAFDPHRVARYSEADLTRLMQEPGLIRNRLKMESLPKNAAAFLRVQAEFGSFARYLAG